MEAVGYAARTIKTGEADLILAGGVESKSRAPKVMAKAESAFSRATEVYDTTIGWRFTNPRLAELFGKDEMPETAENVAREFSISRRDQDLFAYRSQQRAKLAMESGRLADEPDQRLLVGHKVPLQDGHMARGQPVHPHPLESQPFQDAVAALGAVAAAVAFLPGRAAIGDLAG